MMLAPFGKVSAQYREGPGSALFVDFVVADAVGDLGYAVDKGYGLEVGAGLPIGADGHLRLRGDLGFSVYGLEHIEYCSFACRVSSTLTTANSIFYGGIGPEIVFGSGNVQPYVHGSAGLSWFVTSSSLDDHDGYGPYLETTNYSDTVFSWRVGTGVRFGVGHGPLSLDLGVTHHDNQMARYLTRGDIVDNADGSITMYPNQSDADLLSFKVGLAIRLR
jgi:hypothetical protein